MTDNITPVACNSVPEREGPARLGPLCCTGCKHLQTKQWREFMVEDDEWDSGTHATCLAVNKSIGGSYWSYNSSAPDWCPFLDRVGD